MPARRKRFRLIQPDALVQVQHAGPCNGPIQHPRLQERLEQQEDDEFKVDLQTAIAASLFDQQQSSKTAVDDLQKEMQDAYVALGGSLVQDGDEVDGRIDVPQNDAIMAVIPETGITFKELATKRRVASEKRGSVTLISASKVMHARVTRDQTQFAAVCTSLDPTPLQPVMIRKQAHTF